MCHLTTVNCLLKGIVGKAPTRFNHLVIPLSLININFYQQKWLNVQQLGRKLLHESLISYIFAAKYQKIETCNINIFFKKLSNPTVLDYCIA